jgi:hypothetical protein
MMIECSGVPCRSVLSIKHRMPHHPTPPHPTPPRRNATQRAQVGFPVTTIKDYEIEPDAGSGINPFRDDASGPAGTYTLHVTPTGKQTDRDGKLLPNQLALCPEGFDPRKCRQVNAVMLMRFYTSGACFVGLDWWEMMHSREGLTGVRAHLFRSVDPPASYPTNPQLTKLTFRPNLRRRPQPPNRPRPPRGQLQVRPPCLRKERPPVGLRGARRGGGARVQQLEGLQDVRPVYVLFLCVVGGTWPIGAGWDWDRPTRVCMSHQARHHRNQPTNQPANHPSSTRTYTRTARPTAITSMIMSHFSKLIPPFADPVRHNKNDNFVMYLGEDTAKAGVYPNLDAAYLLAVGYDVGLPAGTHMIAKVTATLPMTARNLVAQPKIANRLDYDVRYASYSTLGLVEGGPTADTLDDAAFIRFYQNRPGWNEDRKVSFVVAPDKDTTCGIYDPAEDLFLTTKIRGVAQDYWGASCGLSRVVCGVLCGRRWRRWHHHRRAWTHPCRSCLLYLPTNARSFRSTSHPPCPPSPQASCTAS